MAVRQGGAFTRSGSHHVFEQIEGKKRQDQARINADRQRRHSPKVHSGSPYVSKIMNGINEHLLIFLQIHLFDQVNSSSNCFLFFLGRTNRTIFVKCNNSIRPSQNAFYTMV